MNLQELESQMAAVLQRVEEGEEFLIAREGTPIARITPVAPPGEPRVPGLGKDEIWMADDFDAQLPEDLLNEFYK